MSIEIQLQVLRLLDQYPEMRQRDLARVTGVSLGKLNFVLKALIEKGFVKWQNFSTNSNRGQYLYLLTPDGVHAKIQLTIYFLHRKQVEYDALKNEIYSLENELSLAQIDTASNEFMQQGPNTLNKVLIDNN